jgi:hypothetical protein
MVDTCDTSEVLDGLVSYRPRVCTDARAESWVLDRFEESADCETLRWRAFKRPCMCGKASMAKSLSYLSVSKGV